MAVWGPGAAPATTIPAGGVEPAHPPARPPHRWWDIVLVPVLALALTILLIAGGILFAEWAGLAPRGEALQVVMPYLDDPVVQNMASIGVYVLLVAALLPLLALRGYSLRQVHFPAPDRYLVIGAALFGVALAFVVAYLFDLLPEETLAEMEAAEIWNLPDTAAGILTFGIFAVIFAPFVEELYFRGIVLPVLVRRFSFAAGAVVSSAFFSAIHGHLFVLSGIGAWAMFGLLFLVGLVLAGLARGTGSLHAPVALHAAYNATLIVPGVVLVLTGGQP